VGNEEAAPTTADTTTTTTRLPLPEIDSIVATQSGTDLKLIIRGGYYKPNAQVTWNGNPVSVTWVNEYQLQVTVIASVVNNAAKGSIIVYNPDPEGGYSRPTWVNVAGGGIRGVVDLRGFVGSPAGMPVVVSLYKPGAATPLQTSTVALSADGSFLLRSGLPMGEYDVVVKGLTWLSRRVSRVLFLNGAYGFTVSLNNGDCDGDNYIGTDDYLILNASFDKSSGEAGFDPRADLNGDGYVGTDDYLILNDNFDKSGD
jgi:hypothetical protein